MGFTTFPEETRPKLTAYGHLEVDCLEVEIIVADAHYRGRFVPTRIEYYGQTVDVLLNDCGAWEVNPSARSIDISLAMSSDPGTSQEVADVCAAVDIALGAKWQDGDQAAAARALKYNILAEMLSVPKP